MPIIERALTFDPHQGRHLAALEGHLGEVKGEVSQVQDMKFRSHKFMHMIREQHSRFNIMFVWLQMFMGSLDYNLNFQMNPSYIPQCDSLLTLRMNYVKRFRQHEHFEARKGLEMLLAKYFEEVILDMAYNFKYDFNARCFPLSILFHNTI